MKRITLYVCASILFLVSFGCNRRSNSGSQDNIIAKAFDRVLYLDDLKGIVPAGTSPGDSTVITENYIDSWLRKQVVIHKAEENLPDEKKDVQKQLDDYRNSLITHAYEEELINQRLDTVISQQEIEKFYAENESNFELRDNIIKVIYLKLSRKSPKIDKAKQWYKSDNVKDKKLLEDYCRQYAFNYYLDDQSWLLFDDLLKEIPIKTYDKEQFLKNNRFIELEDSSNVYLVNIKGFKIRNSISPLSFELDNIRNLIINERKLKLIEEMEDKAFEDAKRKGDIEIIGLKK